MNSLCTSENKRLFVNKTIADLRSRLAYYTQGEW